MQEWQVMIKWTFACFNSIWRHWITINRKSKKITKWVIKKTHYCNFHMKLMPPLDHFANYVCLETKLFWKLVRNNICIWYIVPDQIEDWVFGIWVWKHVFYFYWYIYIAMMIEPKEVKTWNVLQTSYGFMDIYIHVFSIWIVISGQYRMRSLY